MSELVKFKKKIMDELNDVQIYEFPTDDENVADTNALMNKIVPFAVVGSTDEIKIGNKMVKARQYPWGIVQVENENHNDFVKLREMLVRTNMEDLREKTHFKHYELYRRSKLTEMGFQGGANKNFSLKELHDKYDQLKKTHGEEKRKLEERKKAMQDEIDGFNRLKQQTLDQNHSMAAAKGKKK